LQQQRIAQNQKLVTYQNTQLHDAWGDHAIMEMYRQNVIGIQRVADVLWAWEHPEQDYGGRTAWRLFNAATYALAGKVAEKPDLTKRLHQVIDGVCERLN
jgi:hypothetical protein